jgi:hypothetical protein
MSLPYAANRAENLTPPTNAPLDEAAGSRMEALAARVERLGMSAVASMLLRAFKPAAWAGSQMLWLLQPFLSTPRKDPTAGIAGLASFFESEANIDALIERLEGPRANPREGAR